MEYRDRFMRAIYLAIEGIPHQLMNLQEGISVIGGQYDVSDAEVLTVVQFLKGCIDRKEYDIVKKVLRIDPFFGVTDALGEICVCSYAVKKITDFYDFEELTAILDIINIDMFEGVFMQDSPVEIALWENKGRLIDYFNRRGFKNEYDIVEGWPTAFDDIDESCKPITVDDYKHVFEHASELFLNAISEKLQDEVIYIECHENGICRYREIFDSFEESRTFIMVQDGCFDVKLSQNLSKSARWIVFRKKNIGGRFKDSMICELNSSGKRILKMELTKHFNAHYRYSHHLLAYYIKQLNGFELKEGQM